jgi:DMSO/TMAO reductase YedYZ molybdopterin-dependent catalytic subunit
MTERDRIDAEVDEQARAEELAWTRAGDLRLSRKRFLQLLTAGAGAALAPGLPRLCLAQAPSTDLVVKPTPPEFFYDHGSNKEMRWEAMHGRGYLVPNELFYVRNHTRTPRIDRDTWRLRIEGSGVSRPREFGYADLLAMPAVSVIRFIECAGNGRSFFETAYGTRARGTPWRLGAIGVAEWTGVPLRELLARAGLKRSARDVMPEGLDEMRVRRPIPIAKALEPDTLLVYAMNGQVLPPDHGFPARILVPGWVGVASIKWVGRIEVSETALFSPWNTEQYVLPGPGSPRGRMLTFQVVKSAIELGWGADLPAGLLRGRSWSSRGKIARVEVSLDEGRSWTPARLRAPNLAQAWVRWDLEWTTSPPPGEYSLRVRATDELGNSQPERVPFNGNGYLYGAVVDHPVVVR